MKKKTLLVFILFLTLSNIGCSSSNNLNVKHTITYSNKGSKSEARHGHLKINKKYFPNYFPYVIINKKHFVFYCRKHMWGDDGYFPVSTSEKIISIKKSKKKINKNQLAKGWYPGKTQLDSTPSNWIYIKYKKGSWFLDYNKLQDFIKVNKITRLNRFTPFPNMDKKR